MSFRQVRKHNTALWHRWYKMNQRVHQAWPHYETVRICEAWDSDCMGPQQAFINFWEDMGDDFEEHLTLDRTDPNGDYEPHNCRWTTWRVQANNHRYHHTERGRWLTWARKTWGDTPATRVRFHRRMRRGWSAEQAARVAPQAKPKLKPR